MTSQRVNAVAVGILFIAATGFYVLGQSIYAPITGSPEYLELVYPQRARVVAGLLLELLGVLSIPLIALLLYPLLRPHHERAALAYIGIRILESVGLLLALIVAWASVRMSREYLLSEAGTASSWHVVGEAVQALGQSTFLISVAVVFPLSALVLNAVLWGFQLVPRLISGWGLLAAALLITGSVLDILEVLPEMSRTTLEVLLSGPIAVQEMVLAGWLIVKGIRMPSGPDQRSALHALER